MTKSAPIPARERIIDSMVELARCSKLHRIIVAGSTAPELMFALLRRGYVRVATTAACGLPHGQYGVALVDWQGRSIKALETTLDWLVQFLAASAVLVIWLDSPERTANQKTLASMLDRLGFHVEVRILCERGLAISARRLDAPQMAVAA
jgi:hypothetical protein